MATVAVSSQVRSSNPTLPGRRYDNRFFSAMAILILITVFIGFGPTYYLAGLTRAPLPSPILHIHGAVFSCWVLLLVVQTSLISARRVDIHRRLGIAGFCLAGLMVILGASAAINSLENGRTRAGLDPRTFFVVPFTDIFLFATLIFCAMWWRKDSALHKRLVLLATFALLTAALARFQVSFLHGNIVHAMLTMYLFILLLAVYDYWSTRRIYRVTLLGAAWIIALQFLRLPLSQTSAWLNFAGWIRTHATWLK
jgi:hypothetical protein